MLLSYTLPRGPSTSPADRDGFMPVDTEGWFRAGRAAHGETATRMIANRTRRLP